MENVRIIVSLTLLLFIYACAALETAYYETIGDLRDLYCPAADAVPGIVEPLAVCGRRCSGTVGCRGFYHNSVTQTCNLRLADLAGPCHTDTGNRYFKFASGPCRKLLVDGLDPVADAQLTESSHWCQIHFAAYPVMCSDGADTEFLSAPWARLSSQFAWSAGVVDEHQYLQVDFLQNKSVTGIVLKGRTWGALPSDAHEEFVTRFRVLYSIDCENYLEIGDANIFNSDGIDGNLDAFNTVTRFLERPVVARCVKIQPITWSPSEYIAMRFDVLGC